MNRQIRRLGVALLLCFSALFVQLNYIMVFSAKKLNNNPANNRKTVQSFSRPRGSITSADGAILARSRPSADEFKFQRLYPEKELFGHITGYFNFNFGATGVESTYNEELAGDTPELRLDKLSQLFVDKEQVGNVQLTVRKDVQEVARQQLGNRKGSVVAMNPKTGAIIAAWSFPSYDPNILASHDRSAAKFKLALDASPDKPLRARTYQERFFPGSTFKLVTGSNGLESGRVTRDQPVYPVSTSFDIDFTTNELDNFGGEACGGNLFEILRVSCNSAFADMGSTTLGAGIMVPGAEKFGFNRRPPIDLPAPATSVFPTEFPKNQGNGPLARASIGQGDVSASPMQMAMVVSAIANHGRMMVPHVMSRITDQDGREVKSFASKVWTTPLSEPNAQTMHDAMLNVAARGTATGLQIPGFEVGGKTGTAQLGNNRSHTWIVGFAGPPGDPKVAVAVIVENQPGASEFTGGRVAAPIAKAVMEKVLQTIDKPSAPPPTVPTTGSTTTTP